MRLTRDMATNVLPALCSFFPMSTTTLGSVMPWHLWIVMAHANTIGNWMRWQLCPSNMNSPVYVDIGIHDGLSGRNAGPL